MFFNFKEFFQLFFSSSHFPSAVFFRPCSGRWKPVFGKDDIRPEEDEEDEKHPSIIKNGILETDLNVSISTYHYISSNYSIDDVYIYKKFSRNWIFFLLSSLLFRPAS